MGQALSERAVAACGLRARLRSETRAAHEALEARLDRQGRWSLPRYIAFLQATLAVVEPLQPGIARLLAPHGVRLDEALDAPTRLRADLAALGATPTLRDAFGFDSPPLRDAADAFGAAYVIEGSRLGARFIAAALREQLGLPAAQLNYLAPQTPADAASKARWPRLLAALDAYGEAAGEPARRRVLASAHAGFAAFDAAMRMHGVAR